MCDILEKDIVVDYLDPIQLDAGRIMRILGHAIRKVSDPEKRAKLKDVVAQSLVDTRDEYKGSLEKQGGICIIKC